MAPALDTTAGAKGDTSDAAGLKIFPQPLLGQSPSHEHETTVALFIRFPGTLGTAFEKHVHGLDHKALIVVLHRKDALHSKDVCSEILRDLLNPGNEPLRIERAVGGQRQAADLVVVFMVVCFGKKSRFDLEHAFKIKAIPAQPLSATHPPPFGPMNPA